MLDNQVRASVKYHHLPQELFELLGDLERIENRDARAAVELDDLLLLRGDSVKVALDLLEELPIIHVDSCV